MSDESFLSFLQYQHKDCYDKIQSKMGDETLINTFMSTYKSDFEAWLKIPELYRYPAENYMIQAAKQDPLFTLADAQRVKEEHDKTVAEKIIENPVIEAFGESTTAVFLANLGASVTQTDIRRMHEHAKTLTAHGYSSKTAEAVSKEYAMTMKLFEEADKAERNESLTQQERQDLVEQIKEEINISRVRRKEFALDECEQTQPERMLMLTIRDWKAGKISDNEAALKIEHYTQQTKELGREKELEEQLSKNWIQNLSSDKKEALKGVLKKHGIDYAILGNSQVVQAENTDKTSLYCTQVRLKSSLEKIHQVLYDTEESLVAKQKLSVANNADLLKKSQKDYEKS